MIAGLLIPSFDEYMYFYLTLELKFELKIVAWLKIVQWLGVILGIIIFLTLLKERSYALAIGIALVPL